MKKKLIIIMAYRIVIIFLSLLLCITKVSNAQSIVIENTPTNIITNHPFGIQARILNSLGQTDLSFNGNVIISLHNGQGSLVSTSGLTKAVSNGVCIWNDLYYNAVDTFRVRAEISSILPVIMDTFSNVIHCINSNIIGNGNATLGYPFSISFGYSRSASLYSSAEVGFFGNLAEFAWFVETPSVEPIPIKIFIKTTQDTAIKRNAWDSLKIGAIMVYDGIQTFNNIGWHSIYLDNIYNYQNNNLLIFCEANYGNNGNANEPKFTYSLMDYKHASNYNNITPPADSVFVNNFRPNIKILLQTQKTISNIQVSHANNTAKIGSNNNPILLITANILGNSGSIFLDSIKVNGLNTDVNDIKDNGVKLFLTDKAIFNTNTQIGTGISFNNSNIVTFTSPIDLPPSKAYLWLSYDISCTAHRFDTLDAFISPNNIIINHLNFSSITHNTPEYTLIDTTIINANAYTIRHITCAGSDFDGIVSSNAQGSNNGYSYKWERNGTSISVEKMVDSLYTGLYRLIVFDSICTNIYGRDSTNINDAPWKIIIPNDTMICSGNEMGILATYIGNFPSHVPCLSNCDMDTNHCIPSFNYGSANDYISKVELNRNISLSTYPSHGQYQDFTGDIFGNFLEGRTDTISLTINNSSNVTEYVVVFIDWNRDGTFNQPEDSIFVGLSTFQGTHTFIKAINVPTSISSGNTRMRVSTRWNAPAESCNTLGYGESEDYTVSLWKYGTPEYHWILPNNSLDTGWLYNVNSISSLDTGVYTFHLVYGTCADSERVNIDVHPFPNVTYDAPFVTCNNDTTINLEGGSGLPSGGTFLYSGNGVNANQFNPSVSGQGQHNITFTYTLNGCSDDATSSIQVLDCVGIDENANNTLVNIYPIPAQQSFTIESTNDNFIQIIMYDINGKKIFTSEPLKDIYQYNIETLSFEKGMYLLKIIFNKNILTKMIIIN